MLWMVELIAGASRWVMQPKNAMALGAAALLAFSGIQTWRVSNLKGDVKELKSDLKEARAAIVNPVTKRTWESEAKSCDTALRAQNAALAALKADGDRRAQELREALQAAQKASKKASDAASTILKFEPPKTDDQCARLLAVEKAITEASR